MDDCHSRISRARGTAGVRLTSMFLLVLLLASHALAVIPYTPSHLLYSPEHNGSFAYLLRSAGSGQTTTTQLLSLNISSIDGANPNFTALSNETLFKDGSDDTAFVPVIDQHGIIKTYAGSCKTPLDQSALWQFTPNPSSSIGNGTWQNFPLGGHSDTNVHGPNYLSAGFAYAFTNTSISSVYSFGGMCPSANSSGPAWVSAANYSQSMTVLYAETSDNATAYHASTTGERAPPIAEAGFAIAPLHPAYGTTAGGNLLQQQDFLLVGGHTQKAFINMSQLAIFSLPQSSWSFVTIGSSRDTHRTELAVRDVPEIEPRSGHSAVLSPDGSKVIVFGGWVGNTSVPATPQLVVLEMSETDMGSADWIWRIPSSKNTGIPQGSGIYGHGAAMLPGGVMMIAGGYSISQSSKSKRADIGPQRNSQTFLYNVTSESWVNSYKSPYAAPNGKAPSPSVPETTATPDNPDTPSHSSKPRDTGLGVGIGLGVPALAGTAAFLWFYFRRRRVRESRDQELRKLALGAQRAHFWGRDEPFMASSIRNPPMSQMDPSTVYPWAKNQGSGRPGHYRDNSDANAERTGLLMDPPSPSKSHGWIAPAAKMHGPLMPYEYRRANTTGHIHPIDERDEDETEHTQMLGALDPADNEDNFVTARNTVRESEPPKLPELKIPPLDIDAGSSSSPDKTDRTSPILSDSSQSMKSIHDPHELILNPPILAPTGRQSPEKPGSSSSTHKSRPDTLASSQDKRYSSDSYSTANTTFYNRRAEGEHLLKDEPDEPNEPSSPVDLAPKPLFIPRPRATEWIGNVRRVLSLSRRPSHTDSPADISPSTTSSGEGVGIASGIDRRSTVLATSPKAFSDSTADTDSSKLPRRSVSASAELFRRKQGARDWAAANRGSREISGFQTVRSTSTTAMPAPAPALAPASAIRDDFGLDGTAAVYRDRDVESRGRDGDDYADGQEDWDVEGAAEGRRVQVTFTVPKERLRVVNATAGELDNGSDVDVSRRGVS